MNTDPTSQEKPVTPEVDPKPGQEEVIQPPPIPFNPNQPKPSELPPVPEEGPSDPEEPINIPLPDPSPSREEGVNFQVG